MMLMLLTTRLMISTVPQVFPAVRYYPPGAAGRVWIATHTCGTQFLAHLFVISHAYVHYLLQHQQTSMSQRCNILLQWQDGADESCFKFACVRIENE